jgi:hypothetical protein
MYVREHACEPCRSGKCCRWTPTLATHFSSSPPLFQFQPPFITVCTSCRLACFHVKVTTRAGNRGLQKKKTPMLSCFSMFDSHEGSFMNLTTGDCGSVVACIDIHSHHREQMSTKGGREGQGSQSTSKKRSSTQNLYQAHEDEGDADDNEKHSQQCCARAAHTHCVTTHADRPTVDEQTAVLRPGK